VNDVFGLAPEEIDALAKAAGTGAVSDHAA
jgi:hypothetical protein